MIRVHRGIGVPPTGGSPGARDGVDPEVDRLVTRLVPEFFPSLDVAGEMVSTRNDWWIARIDSRPVGFVVARRAADEIEIHAVAVDAPARRRGVGRALVRAVVNHARRTEAGVIALEVNAANTAAIGLYRDFGFEVTRTRRGYYQGTGDALEMIRTLRIDGRPEGE